MATKPPTKASLTIYIHIYIYIIYKPYINHICKFEVSHGQRFVFWVPDWNDLQPMAGSSAATWIRFAISLAISQKLQNLNSYMDYIVSMEVSEMGVPPVIMIGFSITKTIQLAEYTTHWWKPPGFKLPISRSASRRCRGCKVAFALSGNTFLTFLSQHEMTQKWNKSAANHNETSIC